MPMCYDCVAPLSVMPFFRTLVLDGRTLKVAVCEACKVNDGKGRVWDSKPETSSVVDG